MKIKKVLNEVENKLFKAMVNGKVDKFAFDTVKVKLDKTNNLVERYTSNEIDMIMFNRELILLNDSFVAYALIASEGTVLKELLLELSTTIIDYSTSNMYKIQMLYN